jgi:precorrin-6A/cobalt-precorrin-6A reductase
MPSSPMPTMDSQRAAVQLAASDMRVLILGGTTEASALAKLLAGDPRFEATLSFAGRTAAPQSQPIATRVGGFGGADGLANYIKEQAIEAVIDATHPYAPRISANAVVACKRAGVGLATLIRPAWKPEAGDKWQTAPTAVAAALAIGKEPRRVFLALGRQELHSFAAIAQHHYVVRLIDQPVGARPHNLVLLQQRGPFDFDAELRLLKERKIDVIVSRNSGGSATYAKIEAARVLRLPVIMITRPVKPAGHIVRTAEEAMAWLAHERPARSLRGV